MTEFEIAIIKQASEFWPKRTVASAREHLLNEVEELKEATDEINEVEEIIDVLLCAFDMLLQKNISPEKAMKTKMKIVEIRFSRLAMGLPPKDINEERKMISGLMQ